MNITPPIRRIIVEVISFLYVLLFVYAAASKLLDFENFKTQLGQSPILSPFAPYVSFLVIIAELGNSVLLSVPKFKYIGLWMAAAMMIMFTAYIYLILNFSAFIPCSCGGILEKLSWRHHLVFNLVFLALAVAAIFLYSYNRTKFIGISVLGVLCTGFVIALLLLSEDIMTKENPFTRRIPNATAAKTKSIDLKNNSYYIAGMHDKKIYLGNRLAPLQILEVDQSLTVKKKYTIKLNRENFKFKAVEVKVKGKFFYVTDGTVPVIFKGKIADWKAHVITENKFYFSEIAFMNNDKIAFRAQLPSTAENMLGITDERHNSKVVFSHVALEKQKDGIFDTDGTLAYSELLDKILYTYYYRNQYIIMDARLKVENRGNTIDTTTKAKLKVIKLKSSGDTKLAAPPLMVNLNTAVCNNLIFVNSQLRGRYEGDNVWKHAQVIDVYDFEKRIYLLSFYVYDEQGLKMKSFYPSNSGVYIISGHYLLKYDYGKNMKSKFK